MGTRRSGVGLRCRRRGAGALRLEQLRIDQEAEPPGLQHAEDEALDAVEEAELEEVAIEEQCEGAEKQGRAIGLDAQVSFVIRSQVCSTQKMRPSMPSRKPNLKK